MKTLILLLGSSFSVLATEKPNIVFILADDLGRHDCGFMGSKINTPHLDKLAGSGAKLDAHYVQPLCSPTRAALMTGRYPMRHGLQSGVVRPWAQYGLPLEERTLPQALKDAGYVTAVVGKWHLGHFTPDYLPTRRGFDFQYGHYNGALDYFTHERDGGFDWHRNDKACRDEGYSTHLIGREASEIVKNHDISKPLFLYVPFNAVHAPHQSPKGEPDQYPDLKGDRKIYAHMLTAMDAAVGQIVAALEAKQTRKNTFFVFSSDNGGPSPRRIADNGLWRAGKGTLYEGGVRVVAFATWEGHITPGITITEPMHIADWFPTFVKLAGAPFEQKLPLDGLDVLPMLTQGKPSPHETILINTSPGGGAVRVGDWKLVVRTGIADDGGSKVSKGVELFNLKDDPSEKSNLADKHQAKVKLLEEKLAMFAKQAVPPKNRAKPKGFVVPKIWGEKS